MGNSELILIILATISSWYMNTQAQPKEIFIMHENTIIQKYRYSPRYSCPIICETNHIHFATDSLYKKKLNK